MLDGLRTCTQHGTLQLTSDVGGSIGTDVVDDLTLLLFKSSDVLLDGLESELDLVEGLSLGVDVASSNRSQESYFVMELNTTLEGVGVTIETQFEGFEGNLLGGLILVVYNKDVGIRQSIEL